jgi:hypothetical protein
MPARRLVLLPVVLVVLALAGVAAAADPTNPQISINPIDQSWAESMVLAPADLGRGWVADPSSEGDSSSSGDESTWCPEGTPNQSDLTTTGGGSSPDFTRGDSSWASSVAIVWQTADQAQSDWDRTLNVMPAFLKCLGGLFSGTAPGVKITVASKGAIPFAAVAPRTSAFRVKLAVKPTRRVKKKRKPLFANYDMVLLGNGRASAWLFLVWFNGKPLSAAYERSLAEKMAARMTTDPAATPAP